MSLKSSYMTTHAELLQWLAMTTINTLNIIIAWVLKGINKVTSTHESGSYSITVNTVSLTLNLTQTTDLPTVWPWPDPSPALGTSTHNFPFYSLNLSSWVCYFFNQEIPWSSFWKLMGKPWHTYMHTRKRAHARTHMRADAPAHTHTLRQDTFVEHYALRCKQLK